MPHKTDPSFNLVLISNMISSRFSNLKTCQREANCFFCKLNHGFWERLVEISGAGHKPEDFMQMSGA